MTNQIWLKNAHLFVKVIIFCIKLKIIPFINFWIAKLPNNSDSCWCYADVFRLSALLETVTTQVELKESITLQYWFKWWEKRLSSKWKY